MANLMDSVPFNSAPSCGANTCDVMQQLQQIRQNPRAFEEHLKKTNPQAYQQAMQIRNSANPQATVMQMAQQRGVHPSILRTLGLM